MDGRLRLLLCLAVGLLPACAGGEVRPLDSFEDPPSLEEVQATEWLAQAADAETRQAWEEAAFYLDRWLLGNEPDERWYERRARAAERSGDHETSVRMRQELVELRPEDALLKVDLADDLQRAGRGQEGAALLEDLARDSETRLLALRALGELHERDGRWLEAAGAYERLAGDPRCPQPRVLWQTAARLRELGGDLPGALHAVEQALEGVDLREEEQRTLDRLRAFETGEPRNVADAVALLSQHPDPELRLRGAQYLSYDRFPDDVAVFAQAVGDEDARVARIAIRELSLRGDQRVAPRLAGLLSSPDPEVKLAAVRGLGRIGTMSEVPELLGLLDPEDRALFRAVRAALEGITGESIGVELDPDLEARRRLAEAWRNWWRGHGAPGGQG